MELARILGSILGGARVDTTMALAGVDEMTSTTPTEAREMANNLEEASTVLDEQFHREAICNVMLQSTNALRSLADQLEALGKHASFLDDQLEALEGQALSSVEREEYFAMKKDAERYRFLKSLEGQERALHVLRFEGAEYLDAQLDRAREAT